MAPIRRSRSTSTKVPSKLSEEEKDPNFTHQGLDECLSRRLENQVMEDEETVEEALSAISLAFAEAAISEILKIVKCKEISASVTDQITDMLRTLALCARDKGLIYEVFMDKMDMVKNELISLGLTEDDVHIAFYESGIDEIFQMDEESADEDEASSPLPPYENNNDDMAENDDDECDKPDVIECESSQSGSEEAIKRVEYKPRVPCKSCRMTRCSNCLVPFKDGDKIVTKIPCMEEYPGNDDTNVSLEVALICIFEPNNPYPKWIKTIEKTTTLPLHLIELLSSGLGWNEAETVEESEPVVAKEKDEEIESTVKPTAEERDKVLEQNIRALFEEVEAELKKHGRNSVESYLDLVRQKIDGLDTQKEDAPTPSEVKAFLLQKLEEFKAQKEKEMKDVKFELTAKKLVDALNYKSGPGVRGLPDFQLCTGCGELLTLLFAAWENYQAKRLTEQAYYYAILFGFKRCKFAQDVIFRAPESSKMFIFNKYGKECHPVGCQLKSTKCGAKFNAGSRKQDLIKNAVGNLHAYLEESYRRVYNELIRLFDENFDDGDGDEDGGETDHATTLNYQPMGAPYEEPATVSGADEKNVNVESEATDEN